MGDIGSAEATTDFGSLLLAIGHFRDGLKTLIKGIREPRRVKDVVVSSLDRAERVAFHLAANGWNVYFGVNPRNGRGGRDSVAVASVCHVDLDGMSFLPAALDTYGAAGIFPSVIVHSGNGAHLYWLLSAPSEDINGVERLNAGLAGMVGADSCWDSTRVLRVPGTDNIPSDKKRAAGRQTTKCVIDTFSDRAYTLTELQDVVPRVDTTTEVVYVDPPKDITPLSTAEEVMYDPYVFSNMSDRSAADWALAVRMFTKGAEPEVVYRALWNSPWSSKARQRGFKYMQYTVAKALRHSRELETFVESIIA